ncbi:hypothetical protein B7755_044485 [Streptomyces sp. NBS 14/10]|uniref:hypothetical protein n=1 Tax=Streptomyces sp. NBS 14/10 TaxID=1945643 RepID=UPI0015C616FE|nr:hypothetical protein [Streptomyces sp. NBS 14/10]KAK1184535.1 hypothetical protein B7755_044485 [Streptomyces sp. NBS 14/10]
MAWNKKSSRGAARICELFSLPSSPHAQRWKDLEAMCLFGKHYAPGLLGGLKVESWSGPINEITDGTPYEGTTSGLPASLDVPARSRNGWVSA